MNLFPVLPVLDELKKEVDRNRDYTNYYVVSVQHLLETTGSLFEAIMDIGIKPQNIYLLGKPYSTHRETKKILQAKGINVFSNRQQENFGTLRENLQKDVAHMWSVVAAKLRQNDVVIILDDGGLAIKRAPNSFFSTCKFYGIEQTTFGLRYQNNVDHFPIIQVATSAAKKFLEPNLISRALFNKIYSYLRRTNPKTIGVIGFGNIGKAVAHKLSRLYPVSVYDSNPSSLASNIGNLKVCTSSEELIQRSDVIIGATGIDISTVEWDTLITSDKTFISVSSGDIEFNAFLKRFNDQLHNFQFSPLSTLVIQLPTGAKATIYRGGTVANFNGSKESCPMQQIQLTRGLLFAGVLQAINNNIHFSDSNGAFKLRPSFQKIVVQKWLSEHPRFKRFYPAQLLQNFSSEKWIADNSGGRS